MIKKLVSKSFTRAGESWVPRCPVRFRNVPIISSTPPVKPHPLKQAMPAFLGEAVKFREAGKGQQSHEQQKDAIGNQLITGEHGRENHRPENHGGDQPAEKNFCLRGRRGCGVGHSAKIIRRGYRCQFSIAAD